MRALTDERAARPDAEVPRAPGQGRDARRPAARGVRRLPRGRPAAPRTCGTSTCRSSAASSCTAATSPRWSPAKARRSSPRCRPTSTPWKARASTSSPSTTTWPAATASGCCRSTSALGITAGYIQSDMDPVDRRKAYDCDITYGTNSEFGFDYLRDNMKPARWGDPNFDPYYQQCQKALNFAIIDEVDNILIDEARTPLIISGPAFSDVRRYAKANDIAVQLTDLQKKDAEQVLRGQGEGTHLPSDRRRHPQGRGTGRRRELLHGRQHGMAAPHRQRPQGASPLQEGQAVRGDAPPGDRAR